MVVVQVFTRDRSCVKASDQGIEALFNRWNDSLKTGDAYQINANYTDDTVLLSTLSSSPRTTSAQHVDYFKDFLAECPIAEVESVL
ncbi:hypothetical protein [Wolbachia endosymbiont of Mansonella perstans]|uniref:hypothetical protein n=1 Tax=Wolbachia endosymbiont of Mansonella perstans TaxID=229526 RepID=UPI001CE112DA|nr:hypothetical protein [Wolbachia endosymbiont of Mansonella perstans]MCA4774294.1 hypothetical protein [Wolbachia endosymbiont of Mansonella perstans]